MREITSPADLVRACADDPLTVWAAQGLAGRSRAWTDDAGSVVVAAPDLSRRDRLAVHASPAAPPGSAVALVRRTLDEVGPTFRPLGALPLIEALAHGIPDLTVAGTFSWMDRAAEGHAAGVASGAQTNRAVGPVVVPGPGGAVWLPVDAATEVGVDALLDLAFPDSYARPGDPGIDRWAGVRAPDGTLLAVAALAWSAPDIALLAGVAAHPAARGQGLAARVCALAVREALTAHGRVGLMVDDWNTSAVRLYRRLGLTRRAVAAAAFS